jgi:uncharacterized protein (TIGR02246 family)
MKRIAVVLGVTAVVLAGGCAKPVENAETATTTSVADDEAAIAQLRESWISAWKQGNVAAATALYASDANDMNNHQPTAAGSAAIQSAIEGTFNAMTPTSVVLTSEKTAVSGDMAYDRGTFDFTLTPKAGGAPVRDTGRYLVVLRKQADGSWKLAELMGNSPTPLPMPASQ